MESKAIVWFRQDLRLHDNEALLDAMNIADFVVPVYVFDHRLYEGTDRFGNLKIGYHRRKFIRESVLELKTNLQLKGADLIIRTGKPEEVLFELARKLKASWICCNRERTSEEVRVQEDLEKKLWSIGLEIRFSRGKMLFYTQDLPFPISHAPDTFSQFKKEVDRLVAIRDPLVTPDKISWEKPDVELGNLPSNDNYQIKALNKPVEDKIQTYPGGESAGLDRLKNFIWGSGGLAHYKLSRNAKLGSDDSSRLSPWLAQGCVSPKMIYAELKRFELEEGGSEHIHSFYLELLWRDFFRLNGKKHGNALFRKGGLRGVANPRSKEDKTLFEKWAMGQTGVPVIDATMRELNLTGFITNRGRQLVASFLVKDLELNWQMGAAYFESQLIDYDACSNWGNWNYIAGVGNDPREEKHYNIISQAKKYDPAGDYVKFWIPELQNLPAAFIHCPDRLGLLELQRYDIQLGKDYPFPLINTEKWVT